MKKHGPVYVWCYTVGAAVVAVPVFKRIGLGSVLGYLGPPPVPADAHGATANACASSLLPER